MSSISEALISADCVKNVGGGQKAHRDDYERHAGRSLDKMLFFRNRLADSEMIHCQGGDFPDKNAYLAFIDNVRCASVPGTLPLMRGCRQSSGCGA